MCARTCVCVCVYWRSARQVVFEIRNEINISERVDAIVWPKCSGRTYDRKTKKLARVRIRRKEYFINFVPEFRSFNIDLFTRRLFDDNGDVTYFAPGRFAFVEYAPTAQRTRNWKNDRRL